MTRPSRHLIEVAPGIHVGHSRRDGTNSTVLVAGSAAVLIDPAWDSDELDGLANWLQQHRLTVVGGFATHAHHDHLLWHPRFGSAPRYASSMVAELASEHRLELIAALGQGWPSTLADLVGQVQPLPGSGWPWPACAVELVTHDAHAPGHTAVWLPQQKVLICGDMLSDVELPLPEDGGIAEYLDGLALLAPFVRRAVVLVPGHGAVATEPDVIHARLEADRQYWTDLLRMGSSSDPRITHPGMDNVHQDNLALASAFTGTLPN